jgi:glycine betaine/proline transport system ATP-binding protein
MIMQRRAALAGEDGHVWLDSGRRYRLALDASDQAMGVHLDGVEQAFCHIRDDADLTPPRPGLALAPASLSLQSIIQLRQTTGHPVLFVEDGKILGVCGEGEIIRALAGGRHTGDGTSA